ncbi:endonuclease/exonuclease/phosphatase family protein [Planococcus sp. ISL-110]|uniref:endonuclease/exonuclease/phosphatase family protein n=1 Tax=Planococcus sp. ISL-110 TaxID=2819167 RepID=UPI001BE667CA|nr:endonuclease/exonuclease/phosphatase family protein [Planococcus sp. ISL-110]MBT2571007.1 endonuclease/exonuclease/phosphatase family protein [Planococcus sp. ISL-110]
MKLLTLNCHSWHEENQYDKIRHFAETIKEKDYDVIALQEVNQSIDAELLYGDIKKDNFGVVLLEELERIGAADYSLVWSFSHLVYGIYEEGVAILTKHPISEEYSFFVSQSTDITYWKTRKIVGVQIHYQDMPLSFYSCHMGWWIDEEEPFKQQADQLLQQINRDGLAFLMGDFNNCASLTGEGYDYLISQKLHDTYEFAEHKDHGTTVEGKIAGWHDNKQDLRIDLILASSPIKVQSSHVIFNNRNKSIISDHFGVEATVIIPKASE